MRAKFGQNFLIDSNVAKREVQYANISDEDVVLEIGPGKGILTRLLAQKAKKVVAIEIDKNLVNSLKNLLPDNVEILNDDATKIDFNKLPKFNKIVSNLPFQISSPITFKILGYDFDLAVLIYQKEFADRLIAKPKSKAYSRLTVNVYYNAECELLETVPSICFDPEPKVDSCIIKIKKRDKPPFYLVNENFFYFLVKKLFNNRRKKIKNIIDKIIEIKDKKIPYANNRVEELSPEKIGNLSNILYNLINS
jgi:16S rRNA (adenine1518-N6/adenine1519-N6)-dimethyltransferase